MNKYCINHFDGTLVENPEIDICNMCLHVSHLERLYGLAQLDGVISVLTPEELCLRVADVESAIKMLDDRFVKLRAIKSKLIKEMMSFE